MKYFIIAGGTQQGPYTKEEMRDLHLTRTTPVWHDGLVDWTTIDRVPALCNYLFGATEKQLSSPDAVPPLPEERRQSPARPPLQSAPADGLKPGVLMGNAIAVTVLGVLTSVIGMVFGILAITKVNRGKNLAAADFEASQAALRQARTFCILGYVFAVIGFIGSLIVLKNMGNILSLQDFIR